MVCDATLAGAVDEHPAHAVAARAHAPLEDEAPAVAGRGHEDEGQQAAGERDAGRDQQRVAELVDQRQPADGDGHGGDQVGDLVERAEPPAPEVEAEGEAGARSGRRRRRAMAASRPPRSKRFHPLGVKLSKRSTMAGRARAPTPSGRRPAGWEGGTARGSARPGEPRRRGLVRIRIAMASDEGFVAGSVHSPDERRHRAQRPERDDPKGTRGASAMGSGGAVDPTLHPRPARSGLPDCPRRGPAPPSAGSGRTPRSRAPSRDAAALRRGPVRCHPQGTPVARRPSAVRPNPTCWRPRRRARSRPASTRALARPRPRRRRQPAPPAAIGRPTPAAPGAVVRAPGAAAHDDTARAPRSCGAMAIACGLLAAPASGAPDRGRPAPMSLLRFGFAVRRDAGRRPGPDESTWIVLAAAPRCCSSSGGSGSCPRCWRWPWPGAAVFCPAGGTSARSSPPWPCRRSCGPTPSGSRACRRCACGRGASRCSSRATGWRQAGPASACSRWRRWSFLVAMGGTLVFALAVWLSWHDLRAVRLGRQRARGPARRPGSPGRRSSSADASDSLGSAHDVLGVGGSRPPTWCRSSPSSSRRCRSAHGEGQTSPRAGSTVGGQGRLPRADATARSDRHRARSRSSQQPCATSTRCSTGATDQIADVPSPWLVGPVRTALDQVPHEVDRRPAPGPGGAAGGRRSLPGCSGATAPATTSWRSRPSPSRAASTASWATGPSSRPTTASSRSRNRAGSTS